MATPIINSQIDAINSTLGELADDLVTLRPLVKDVKDSVAASYITDTATGAIASFPDGADGIPVKDLKVAIEPVQSGSGDPSPTNIRPISGWSGAEVYRTGKNLFDKNAVATNKWLNTTTGLEENSVGYAITDYIPVKANNAIFIPSSSTSRRWFYDANKSPKQYLNVSGDQVFTPTENGYIRVTILVVGQGAKDLNTYQIEYGSSASAYEPFGNTYPISWQTEAGTVYGGELNGSTGVMTVDRAMVQLGSLSWHQNRSGTNAYECYADISGIKPNTQNLMSNIFYQAAYADTATYTMNSGADYVTVKVPKSVASTSANLKTWLANNGAILCYELATPQTYQLSPIELSTILGNNNIWCSTGSTNVVYRADAKLYIDKKLAEVMNA